MTRELLEEYIRLAQDVELPHKESAQKVNDYIVNSTARYHGRCVRTMYVPKIFSEADEKIFAYLVHMICQIFYKVMDRYEQDEEYRRLFGFAPELEQLILRKPAYDIKIPIARIDIFYDEETKNYKFCEFNTDGTSAMNEDRELNIAIQHSIAYQEFAQKHDLYTRELFDTWAIRFLEIYQQSKRAKETPVPQVAIVDFMENATEMEFRIFKERFEAHGMKTQICEIRDVQYRNGALYTPEGMRIDAIYRRAVTSDIMKHYEEVADFLAAVNHEDVILIGDFRTQIAHNKILYKILHLPQTQAFLTEEEWAFVQAHVPYTYDIEDARLYTDNLWKNKDRWIIKPEDSYGSQGVHAGVECTQEEWEQYFLKAREDKVSKYLVQEFCLPYQTQNIDYTQDAPAWIPVYNLTGLFTYAGEFCGAYSRISKSEIISTQYSEMAIPTVFVRGE